MKKILLCITKIMILVVLLIGYGYYNLKSNSVYYAKHIPHKEGTEPVLMMLVDNLNWIYNPDIDGIEYDFDGQATIKMYSNNINQVGVLTSYTDDGKRYSFDDIKSGTSIEFNSRFKAIEMYDISDSVQKIAFTETEEKENKRIIYNMLKPIIDRQTKPLINLQWVFNRIYRDKFN